MCFNLWKGPALQSTGAKVAWRDVCKLRSEGGLGIRNLKEVNRVNGLKLIWRLLSGDSLWGDWIRENLLKRKNFWSIKENTQAGSWMWRKILKLREAAKFFYKREVGNGRTTSFWYDNWSTKGVLMDVLGEGGIIGLGISRAATVEEAVKRIRRRRSYRSVLLNSIDAELVSLKGNMQSSGDDCSLWRDRVAFKKRFSTKET